MITAGVIMTNILRLQYHAGSLWTGVNRTFAPVFNVVTQPHRSFSSFHLWLSQSQVLSPVSTLAGPYPWNWNFLVYHRVPFQQACTQLSFNHSPQSYRCVWLGDKVSLSWFGTQGSFSFSPYDMFSRLKSSNNDGFQPKRCFFKQLYIFHWMRSLISFEQSPCIN